MGVALSLTMCHQNSIMTNSCPKQRSGVSVRVVEGETVVLDRNQGLIHQLNRTASYIWDRCNGRFTVREIAHQLADAFDIEPQTATRDVAAVVEQLQELQLLESSAGD